MPDYKFSVSLKILHPKVDAKTISDTLSLSPTISHDTGDLRVTKNGRLLGGSYEDMFWNLDLCDGKRIDTEDVLFEEFIAQKIQN